jgi:hypothetical protein
MDRRSEESRESDISEVAARGHLLISARFDIDKDPQDKQLPTFNPPAGAASVPDFNIPSRDKLAMHQQMVEISYEAERQRSGVEAQNPDAIMRAFHAYAGMSEPEDQVQHAARSYGYKIDGITTDCLILLGYTPGKALSMTNYPTAR